MNDPILYWNTVALDANLESHTNGKNEQTGPTLSSRAMAIVHLAMYDAFAGAMGNPPDLPPYLPNLPQQTVTGDTVAEAAVAAAAHATLGKLFPAQQTVFDLKHKQAGLSGAGLAEGHDFGLLVATRLLAERKDDPDADDDGHAPSMARGRHRVDPDNPDQGYHAPFYGRRSDCFAAATRFGLAAPPAPNSNNAAYLTALQEVRGKGVKPELMATVPAAFRRTPNETLIGLYWGYDGAAGLGTPPRLYNQILREVAMKISNPANAGGEPNSPAQNARLFALVNAAMGDAGILAWEQKYHWDYWRPVVGIREHDSSMGPAGIADNSLANHSQPDWLPLGAPATNALFKTFSPPTGSYPHGHTLVGAAKNFTPPFPAYPSGHATFGAAAFHIARRYYGIPADDKNPDMLFKTLSFVSDELNGVNKDNTGTIRPKHARTFPNGLWEMIEENGRSRVFLGVHWVFDAFALDQDDKPDYGQNIGGVKLGLAIANDIFDKGMKQQMAAKGSMV